MKKPNTSILPKSVFLALAVAAFAVSAPSALADDIPLSHLPPQVTQAILDRYPSATFVKAERETEDGQVKYEVEIKVNGEERDVEVSATGRILEIND